MDPNLISAGAVIGFFVGLTGMGGGSMMTPLLILMFGVSPALAVGTDLWFAAITKLFASRVYHGHGLIDWKIARKLWTGSLTGCLVTTIFMSLYSVTNEVVGFLKVSISIAVMITAVGLIFRKSLHELGTRKEIGNEKRFKSFQGPLTIVTGFILGVLVTLTSVGAGVLGTVFLTYLYPIRLSTPRLVATEVIHAIPLAAFAGIGSLVIGNVNVHLLKNLLTGSIPTVILGAYLSSRLPHGMVRIILAIVLLSMGVKLFWAAVA